MIASERLSVARATPQLCFHFNDLLAHRARCHTQFQTRAAQITFTSQHLDGSKTL